MYPSSVCSLTVKSKEGALSHKVKHLTRSMLLIAGDLQIMGIDHSRDHTECRADSKIIST